LGLSPNPIVSSGKRHVVFSNHARFRMDEADFDKTVIEKVLASPDADFEIDPKSGNYVFERRDTG